MNQELPQKPKGFFDKKTILLALGLVLCFASIIWVANRPVPERPSVPQIKLKSDDTAQRLQLFQNEVEPKIVDATKLNREAADRCIQRLNESFEGYRSGIEPFCDEINSWGTRFGVIRRMPGDWWYEKTDVKKFVEEKFSRHLFDDKKLASDIDDALSQFRQEIAANQNSMLLKIRASISNSDLPEIPKIEHEEFARELQIRLTDFSTNAAETSVVKGLVTEIASGTGGVIVEQLLAHALAKLGTAAATTSASAGGATAGGAAAGGGGGSFGGPLGTVGGFAVGVAVGVVIDWWLSGKFKAEMTKELNELIDEIKSEVITGAEKESGLRMGLGESCTAIATNYESILRHKIVGEVTQ